MVSGRRAAALICPPPGETGRLLCRIDDLVDNASKGFDPLHEGRDTMFVVRRGEAVFAYRNACPHYDFARMAWRKDEFMNADRSRIRCSAHGALFRIEDGSCEIGPCIGETLVRVPVAIRQGELWLLGPYSPGLRRTLQRTQGNRTNRQVLREQEGCSSNDDLRDSPDHDRPDASDRL